MTEYNPRDLADLVLRPIVTEKATILLEQNKYVFEVIPKATKPEIKAAIESLFEVKVVGVNTLRLPRKKRRVGRFVGYKPQYKRAVITLADGDSITLFPDV
ncbi:MAG: 50S ribosomal protein L23 [Symploca sp. SIO2C1]|nr:50S ribosomal protein L23 [Symploca sp. SIO2C1]